MVSILCRSFVTVFKLVRKKFQTVTVIFRNKFYRFLKLFRFGFRIVLKQNWNTFKTLKLLHESSFFELPCFTVRKSFRTWFKSRLLKTYFKIVWKLWNTFETYFSVSKTASSLILNKLGNFAEINKFLRMEKFFKNSKNLRIKKFSEN